MTRWMDRVIRASSSGISLVEVLFIIVFVALTTLPIYLLLNSGGVNSRFGYLNSSRNIIISRILEEVDPENQRFFENSSDGYDDGTTIRSITESGQTFGYLRKPDATNSNALRKRIYTYLYRSPSDALTNYIYRYTHEYNLKELRVDCGAAANRPYKDTSGQLWLPDDASGYGALKRSGWGNSPTIINQLALGDVIYVTDNDTLYLTALEVAGNTTSDYFDYQFDVDNGRYTVQLYFAELNASGPVTRLTDVIIEDVKVLDDYNAYTSTGDVRSPEIQSFDVDVSDGGIYIRVYNGGSSSPVTNKARLNAIAIRRIS